MKVMIVKELMTGDVSPVAMFVRQRASRNTVLRAIFPNTLPRAIFFNTLSRAIYPNTLPRAIFPNTLPTMKSLGSILEIFPNTLPTRKSLGSVLAYLIFVLFGTPPYFFKACKKRTPKTCVNLEQNFF